MEKDDLKSENLLEEIAMSAFEMPTTLMTNIPSSNISSSGIMVSGVVLRKKYIYEQRDLYIEQTGEVPLETMMDVWRGDAEKLYPNHGDHVVKDGQVIYLGIG